MEQPALPLPLADAVIFLIGFLELNDEAALSDPDNVVKALESATFELQQLSPVQRQALAARAEQLADQVEESHHDPDGIAFLRSFGSTTGLLDDDEQE